MLRKVWEKISDPALNNQYLEVLASISVHFKPCLNTQYLEGRAVCSAPSLSAANSLEEA
jgi:hypothetical protein